MSVEGRGIRNNKMKLKGTKRFIYIILNDVFLFFIYLQIIWLKKVVYDMVEDLTPV